MDNVFAMEPDDADKPRIETDRRLGAIASGLTEQFFRDVLQLAFDDMMRQSSRYAQSNADGVHLQDHVVTNLRNRLVSELGWRLVDYQGIALACCPDGTATVGANTGKAGTGNPQLALRLNDKGPATAHTYPNSYAATISENGILPEPARWMLVFELDRARKELRSELVRPCFDTEDGYRFQVESRLESIPLRPVDVSESFPDVTPTSGSEAPTITVKNDRTA